MSFPHWIQVASTNVGTTCGKTIREKAHIIVELECPLRYGQLHAGGWMGTAAFIPEDKFLGGWIF